MLFCYPLEAAQENWLHESIFRAIQNTLEGNHAGNFREFFPPEHRAALARKRGLKAKFERLRAEMEQLTETERVTALRCLTSQNEIPALFDGVTEVYCLPDDMRPQFVIAARELFEAAFLALSSLGVRDRQYEIAYTAIPARLCAFCGIEPLDSPAPEIPREDLDHYLASSIYPFAATNLRNLAPIGQKCNSSYKRAINILVGSDGARRRCFDPYGDQTASLSLLQSKPFEGGIKDLFLLPAWQLEFEGPPEETKTWDSVFSIATRYMMNVLDAELRGWIDHFAQWWARDVAQPPKDTPSVIALLRRYLDGVIQEGFSENAFLKRATFEMFAHQCTQPAIGERLTDWFINLLSPMTGAVASA